MFKDLITPKERIQTSKEQRAERKEFYYDLALVGFTMLAGTIIIITFFTALGNQYGL